MVALLPRYTAALALLVCTHHLRVRADNAYTGPELVLSSFDEILGTQPDSFFQGWTSAESSMSLEYVDEGVHGSGSLRLEYNVSQAESWGGAITFWHMVEDPGVYNLADCSIISFSYFIERPQSLPHHAELRLKLLDGSSCGNDCSGGNRLEHYMAFLRGALDQGPGWHDVTIPLVGDRSSESPMWNPGWNGLMGNEVLDKDAIRGFQFEVSVGVVEGYAGNVTSGALLLDGLKCTGGSVLQSAFHEHSWATAERTGVWKSQHVDGHSEGSWIFAHEDQALGGQHQRILKGPNGTVTADFLSVGHSLPLGAYYNLSGADTVALWINCPPAGPCPANGDAGLAFSFTLPVQSNSTSTRIYPQFQLNPVANTSLPNWTEFRLPLSNSVLGAAGIVQGFQVDVNFSRANLSTFAWGGICALGPDGQCGEPVPYTHPVDDRVVYDEAVVFDIFDDPEITKFDDVWTERACAQLCLAETSCLYFALRLPPSTGNCAIASQIPAKQVRSKAIIALPIQSRAHLIHYTTTYTAGWVAARRPLACGNATHAGVCSCTGSTVLCSNASLAILPDLTGWHVQLETLSLEGSGVTFITDAQLGSAPRLETLHLGEATTFVDPVLLKRASDLEAVQGLERVRNLIVGTLDDGRFEEVCCTGQRLMVGETPAWQCEVQKPTHGWEGADCEMVPFVSYFDQGSLLKQIPRSDSRSGWSATSAGACCHECENRIGCSHFTYDSRVGGESSCFIKSAGLQPVVDLNALDAKGNAAYWSGWTPLQRFESGSINISTSPQSATMRPGDYTFEYSLILTGSIMRGSVWIDVVPDSKGLEVQPKRLAFNGAGNETRQRTIRVTATDASILTKKMSEIVVYHKVVACDQAWSHLNRRQSVVTQVVIHPTCGVGSTYRNNACHKCDAGSYSTNFSEICSPCPHRTVSTKGSSECSVCSMGLYPDSSGGHCMFPVPYYLMAALYFVITLMAMATLVGRVTRRVAIKDVRPQGESCILECVEPHFIFGAKETKIRLVETGFYDGTYMARALGGNRLELLAPDKSQRVCVDTSIGYVVQPLFRRLSAGTLWVDASIPAAVPIAIFFLLAILVLFPPGFTGVSETSSLTHDVIGIHPGLMVTGLTLAPLLMACTVIALSRWHWANLSPVLTSVQEFHAAIRSQAAPCERGPGRAVSLRQLRALMEHFDGYIGNRTMYYIHSNIVRPVTQAERISFAELVGPRQVNWFVSHFWGNPFRDFVATLKAHAEHYASGDAEEVSYWVCTFSINQWRVPVEVGDGDWRQSSFLKALQHNTCMGTLMVLDQKVQPLCRSWCLFEVLQTFDQQKDSRAHFEFLFGSGGGVLNQGIADINLALAVVKSICALDVEQASASDPGDKAMIDALVMEKGGFDQMNELIRSRIREVLLVAKHKLEVEFDNLDRLLGMRHPQEVTDSTPEEVVITVGGAQVCEQEVEELESESSPRAYCERV